MEEFRAGVLVIEEAIEVDLSVDECMECPPLTLLRLSKLWSLSGEFSPFLYFTRLYSGLRGLSPPTAWTSLESMELEIEFVF